MSDVGTEERPEVETEGPAGLSEELVRTVEDALEEGDIERAGEVAASLGVDGGLSASVMNQLPGRKWD